MKRVPAEDRDPLRAPRVEPNDSPKGTEPDEDTTRSPAAVVTPQPVSLDAHRTRVLGALQIVRRYSKATGTARSVLNVLATYADTDGRNVRVGRLRLEAETGLSRSTLRRAIRRLEELGEVETLSTGGGATASRYRITLSPPVENPVDNRSSPGTVPERERVQSDPGPGSERPRDRVQSEPRPVVTGIDREGGAFVDHCPAHRMVEDPPPCRRCQATREANDLARAESIRVARDEERRRRQDATRAAVANDRARAVDPETARRHVDEIRQTLRRPPSH